MCEENEQVDALLQFDDLEDFLEHVDRENREEYFNIRIPKRYLRDRSNPFNFFYEEAFRKRFRFSKDQVIYYLLPIIQRDLEKPNNRGLPVSPVIQLLMALRFYASASYQAVIGDLLEYSQPAVCLCIQKVSVAFAQKLKQFVQFPATAEGQMRNIRMFHEIANFPHVAACIDGTLIKIASCRRGVAEVFRSRKGYFALNILAAVGPRGELLFIDVRHPGSTHDQTCFDRSALKLFFEEDLIKGLLLGDNGYGSQRYLLVPVLNPSNEMERIYNRRHIRTRNTVERTFGRWKRKFSCLSRGLKNNLDNSIAIICATAVLWNLHIDLNYPAENIEINNAAYIDDYPRHPVNGLIFRRNFIQRYFQ